MQITRWIQTAVTPGRWTRREATGSGAAVPSSVLPPGTVLEGRWEIGDLLGNGRASTLYRASDLKMNRPVALRAFPAGRSSGKLTALLDQRLRQEAQALAMIRHPNVVTVFDFGSAPEFEADFLVMEMLDGGSLPDLIRRHGRPNVPAVIRVLSQAAAGVSAGHRAGVVHRTLRPSSLFLEAGDGAVRVRVLDFGLADLAPPGAREQRGSADSEFGSPEQLHGATWIAPASDVFTLGAIAHFVLTGSSVWSADRSTREMEAARQRMRDDHRLPIGLREVLAQALASHPEDRFTDARALLIALDGIDRVEVIPPDHHELRSTGPPAPERSPDPLAELKTVRRSVNGGRVETAGAAAVVTGAAAVCLLASLASAFSLLATAAGLFAGIQLLGPSGHRLRQALVACASLVLLGLMLARALQGSVPDLLFAQIMIGILLPRLNFLEPTRRSRPERSAALPESVAREECPTAA